MQAIAENAVFRALMCVAMLALTQAASAQVPPSEGMPTLPDSDHVALNAALHDLCGRKVALLGEAPTHGDGHTAAFKVALVQQLIKRCHFNAVAFESGAYEFIAFDRARRQGTSSPSMIADAIGGLWKFDREFQPLIGFLYKAAKDHHLRLAGLDSQLGNLGQTYSNDNMVPELAHAMSPEQSSACVDDFARHAYWRYPADHPYGLAEHNRLLDCTKAMRHALSTDPDLDKQTVAEQNLMIDNIGWAIGDDLSTRGVQLASREHWLYRNFTSFAQTLPHNSKVIVWGATVHLAKDASAIQPPEKYPTFGSLVHERYGAKAFSLGFSTTSGSYRIFRKRMKVDVPPASSLEMQAFATTNADAIYLDSDTLNRLGQALGGALEHAYHRVNWATVVDGMVIFREEWPTQSTRPGYD